MDRVPTEGRPVRTIALPRRFRRRIPVKFLLVLGIVMLLLPFAANGAGLLPAWANPFRDQSVDHSAAPLLLAIHDVAQFRAATGTFQVLVDLEHNTSNVPAVISGDRTTLFATGNVDALVDFSALGSDRVSVSPDRRSVTLRLPTPQLGTAVVDPAQSRVVGRQRGLVQRLGEMVGGTPTDDRELYVLAGHKAGGGGRSQ